MRYEERSPAIEGVSLNFYQEILAWAVRAGWNEFIGNQSYPAESIDRQVSLMAWERLKKTCKEHVITFSRFMSNLFGALRRQECLNTDGGQLQAFAARRTLHHGDINVVFVVKVPLAFQWPVNDPRSIRSVYSCVDSLVRIQKGLHNVLTSHQVLEDQIAFHYECKKSTASLYKLVVLVLIQKRRDVP